VSARRPSFLPAKPVKKKSPDVRAKGFVSSTSAVDYYPKAPSIPSAVYLPMLGIQCE
jgi:hypothetical protein